MERSDLTYFKIPYPNAKDLHFKITAPICAVVIAPGIGNAWATGKYVDSMEVAPLSITKSRNVAQLTSVGAYAYRTPVKQRPQMQLSFGRLHPFALTFAGGDMCDQFDLGGLPLTDLEIQFGAGAQSLDFSYPNPQLMSRMKITADAGPVQIEHAANANAADIRLNGDATHYQLNFGEALKQNTSMQIGMSVSTVEISYPAGTAVKITFSNPPNNSSLAGFTFSDNAYWNAAAMDHQEPLLAIHNKASSGGLRVREGG